MTEPDLHEHWRAQPATTGDAEAIRASTERVVRRARARNRLEYLAGGAATIALTAIGGVTLWQPGSAAEVAMGCGFLLLALGMIVVGVELYRRSRSPDDADLARPALAHLTERLQREHRLLRSAWLWYVGPILPGFALIYGAAYLATPDGRATVLAAGGLTLAFLIVVAALNLRAAARIAAALRTLRAEQEED